MARLSIAGMDPSSRNWGIAGGSIDIDTGVLTIKSLRVVRSNPPEGKQVRQNSKDLSTANQLYEGVMPFLAANLIFAEIPQGSQSARASLCSGICIGILGSLRASAQFIEVTPNEVKLAAHGSRTATKKQMIDWAVKQHPEAPWPRKSNGDIHLGDAEHMADAVGAIYAGLLTNQYKQLIQFHKGTQTCN
jgi:Holliday junction resolvasome RuvABC endonuclease subunit